MIFGIASHIPDPTPKPEPVGAAVATGSTSVAEQLRINHERAEEIIRAREATIARQIVELDDMRDLLKRADDALDSYGLGSEGSPLRSAIRDALDLRRVSRSNPQAEPQA